MPDPNDQSRDLELFAKLEQEFPPHLRPTARVGYRSDPADPSDELRGSWALGNRDWGVISAITARHADAVAMSDLRDQVRGATERAVRMVSGLTVHVPHGYLTRVRDIGRPGAAALSELRERLPRPQFGALGLEDAGLPLAERERLALDVKYVLDRLGQVYKEPQGVIWLASPNARLNGRPIDVLRLRGPSEVILAVDIEEQGSYT